MVKEFEETGRALTRGIMRKRKVMTPFITTENPPKCGIVVSDHALSESALCLRSSHKLVWNAGKNGIREKKQFWEIINFISAEQSWCEYWRDKFFGKNTTNPYCFGKPNAPDNFKFGVTFTKKSTQIPLSKSRISLSSWERERYYVTLPDIDDGKRKSHSNMQGMLTSSRIFLFQVCRNNQSKNHMWTSLESACVETVWCSFYWGTDWITKFTRSHFMDIDLQRTWKICGRAAHLWQQSLHPWYFVAEAEGWSKNSCVDSQD